MTTTDGCLCGGHGWIEVEVGTHENGRPELVVERCPRHAPALPPQAGRQPPPESRETAARGRELDEQRFR